MNFSSQFPLVFYISRGDRLDRRAALESRLRAVGIEGARWFPAIDCSLLKQDSRGYQNVPKRSLALGNRHLLRVAERSGAQSVFFFEDDAVFHPYFVEKLSVIELPDDWGIFYLGCQHMERPTPIAPGIVRVRRALDTHAFAVRAPYFREVRAAMRGMGKGVKGSLHSDVLLAGLHSKIPTYAAMPNLCWQLESHSDLAQRCYSNYCQACGAQKNRREAVEGLDTAGS